MKLTLTAWATIITYVAAYPADHQSSDNWAEEATLHPNRIHLKQGTHGAVASDVDICSNMAGELMRDQGGNAVDAAVTTALCLGSINSQSSGIGGGGFITLRTPDGEALEISCREMAPGKATKNMFANDTQSSKVGGLAVGIPGEVKGLQAAHDRHGKLSWKQCVEPVVKLNRDGFKVQKMLADALKEDQDTILKNKEQWGPWIKGDRVAQVGDIVKRTKYADTLELIAENGGDIFYDTNGPIAPHYVEACQKSGGVLTNDDMEKYKVEIKTPLKGSFMGREVLTPHNPSSGPALLFGLNVLEQFAGDEEFGNFETHHLVEAMKFMAAGRSYLGQLNPNQTHIDEIISKDYAINKIKNKVTNQTHDIDYYEPAYESDDPHGTTHFSVIDKDGMAVAMTTTVNLAFGCKVADPKTGIILNSQMDDFSTPGESNAFGLAPSVYNYVKPFNRPLSSMVPSILVNKNGKVEIVIGCAGGSRITTSVFQAIVRMIDYKTSLLDTIAHPRIHHQLSPNHVELEPNMPEHVKTDLESHGHKVEWKTPQSTLNGVRVLFKKCRKDVVQAVGEYWRKQGEGFAY